MKADKTPTHTKVKSIPRATEQRNNNRPNPFLRHSVRPLSPWKLLKRRNQLDQQFMAGLNRAGRGVTASCCGAFLIVRQRSSTL